jgi:hypothetical protein
VEAILLHRDAVGKKGFLPARFSLSPDPQQRVQSEGNKSQYQKYRYYIKWAGYGPEHCSWEPFKNLTNCQDLLAEYWARVAPKDVGDHQKVKRQKRTGTA